MAVAGNRLAPGRPIQLLKEREASSLGVTIRPALLLMDEPPATDCLRPASLVRQRGWGCGAAGDWYYVLRQI